MTSIIIACIIGFAPVPVIYLFYRHYFALQPDITRHVEYFAMGVLLAPVILLAGPAVTPFIPSYNSVMKGFLHIAIIEKTGAFAAILVLMIKSRKRLTVIDAVVSAMLLGLGFATVENILFAVTTNIPVLLVRFMSSVPLHVLSCGLIGYFLAAMMLSSSRMHRAIYFIAALILPVAFHGLYDSLLLLGETVTYWISALMVLLISVMEYQLAKSQILPSGKDLEEDGISLEDWNTLQMQPRFERWMLRSMGARNSERVPFFRFTLTRIKACVLIAITALVAAYFVVGESAISALHIDLTGEEAMMIFLLTPVLYGFDLLVVGIINPEYFTKSMIKIPVIVDTVMSLDVDITKEDDVVDTVTYHITGSNFFIKSSQQFPPGSRSKCILYCSRVSSPVLECSVAWENHDGPEPLNGALVRILSRPPGFWLFLVRYYLYRISWGVIFNLHLPGYKAIRQLFVRPISVMQDELLFPPGKVIFNQGDAGNSFYLVQKGKVDIFKTFKTGKKVLISTLTRGDIFGEMALVGNQPRLATAICKTDCLLAVADTNNLDAIIRGNPEFARKLIVTFANRFQETDTIMFKNIKQTVRFMSKDRKFLFSLMKLLLLSSEPDSDKDAPCINVNIDTVARILQCSREKAGDIFRIIAMSDNEEDFLEGIDRDLFYRIIKVLGSHQVTFKEKK